MTSSNASVGGVCTGLGVGPRAIDRVMGVAKAYTTRVGEGPLPTELSGDMGNRLRDSGNEYGAVTGRPRRCGWYDAVAVRYGVRVNGLDALALTKLDVLDGLERSRVCTAYRVGFAHAYRLPVGCRATRRLPAGLRIAAWMDVADQGRPRFEDLPENARRYIARLETVTGVPAAIVSTGSERRRSTINHDDGQTLKSAISGYLVFEAVPVENPRVGVDELDARAVSGTGLRRNLECCPRHRAR